MGQNRSGQRAQARPRNERRNVNIPTTFYDRVVAANGDTRQAITPDLPPMMKGSVCGAFPRKEAPLDSVMDCNAPPLILAVTFAMANHARLMCSFHTARMIQDSIQAHPAVPNNGWSNVPYPDWTGYYLYWAEQADICHGCAQRVRSGPPFRSGPADGFPPWRMTKPTATDWTGRWTSSAATRSLRTMLLDSPDKSPPATGTRRRDHE